MHFSIGIIWPLVQTDAGERKRGERAREREGERERARERAREREREREIGTNSERAKKSNIYNIWQDCFVLLL